MHLAKNIYQYIKRIRNAVKYIYRLFFKRRTRRVLSVIGWIILCIILIGSTLRFAAGLTITEIMYNPNGSDTGREWIELDLNNSCSNLSTYTLYESGTNHRIELFNGSCNSQTCNSTCTYAILCDTCNTFIQEYFLIATTIPLYQTSFSLSNTGEVISLRRNGSIVDEINYSIIATTAREGYSIIRTDTSGWIQSQFIGGTPGRGENSINNSVNNSITNTTDHTITNATNTTLNNITTPINSTTTLDENNSNNITTSENTTINVTNNTMIITPNTTNNTGTNTTMSINTTNATSPPLNTIANCTPSNSTIRIRLKENKTVYEEGDTIRFSNTIIGNEENYTIEYWVEDLFGNIYKNKVQTTNQNEKSYTPKLSENDHILLIKNKLLINESENSTCNNQSSQNAEQYILVKRKTYSEPADTTCPKCVCTKESTSCPKVDELLATTYDANSHIALRDIVEDRTKKSAHITLDLYRGDTRKSVINIRIVDAKNRSSSSPVKITLEKYSATLLDLSFIVTCKSKENILIIEGLDIIRTLPLTVCEDQIIEQKLSTQPVAGENDIAESSMNTSPTPKTKSINSSSYINTTKRSIDATGNVVYASVNQKNKQYILIGIAVLLFGGMSYTLVMWLRKRGVSTKMLKR
ncbi:MAG: hypothetical protein WC916_01185 [Candidatus Woesearchaeota archaeon]